MTAASSIDLSVVVPAFHEAGRIAETVAGICTYLDTQPLHWQLIVVIDEPEGAAAAEARAAGAARPNVQVLVNGVNRGKGFSVRQGMLAAHGQVRVFIDADLSLPIEGLPSMLAALGSADVAIASRALAESRVSGPSATKRRVLGAAFNLAVRTLAVPGIRDTQCGFKAFTAEAAGRIFGLQRLDRFGFDVEVLRLARRFGYRIVEVPVTCTYHGGSSVSRAADGPAMLVDVLRTRWFEVSGRYKS